MVELGQRVEPGDTILERTRDAHLVDLPVPRGTRAPDPLSPVLRAQASGGAGASGSHAGTDRGGVPTDAVAGAPYASLSSSTPPRLSAEGPGRVLSVGSTRRVRAAVGGHMEQLGSPVTGVVEVVEPGAIGIRAAGVGIAGVVSHGDPVHGRLLLLVGAADAELRASAVDVQGAGAIVVAGAGLDIETLTRARATGIAGIVTGGIAGKDLDTLAAADLRQRASLQPTMGFAVLVVDGYGRRPLPSPAWAWLTAAVGTRVGIVGDPPMLVLGLGVQPPDPPDDVRIAAGEGLGLEGRLLGAAGHRRSWSGVYVTMARVGVRGAASDDLQERLVPFADLERFG